MKTFILQFAAAQMSAAGTLLKLQGSQETDPKAKKRDVVIGKVLNEGGAVLTAFSTNNPHGVDQDLKLIADSIYDYLGQPVPGTGG